jgi:hypothetical protein
MATKKKAKGQSQGQRQNQSKAQKTDCQQGHAQKGRGNTKKGSEKASPAANS